MGDNSSLCLCLHSNSHFWVVSSEVGGKYRNIGKCKEIADIAAEKLRAGEDLEAVRSMCVSWQDGLL